MHTIVRSAGRDSSVAAWRIGSLREVGLRARLSIFGSVAAKEIFRETLEAAFNDQR